MSALSIVVGEDKEILRTKTKPVKEITKKIHQLISGMKEAMLKQNGVGIAAPQVNVDLRVLICRFGAGEKDEQILAMINPEIIWFSDDVSRDEEGCLSLPKVFGQVLRPNSIHVRFQDEKGREKTFEYTGFDARIVQHEVDHLNGILFIDYL